MPAPHEIVSACISAHLGDRSQAWLARKMGTTPSAVSKLLAGHTTWSLDNIAAAAAALGVSFQELLGAASTSDLTDDERLALLILRSRGWKGLALEALSRLQDP